MRRTRSGKPCSLYDNSVKAIFAPWEQFQPYAKRVGSRGRSSVNSPSNPFSHPSSMFLANSSWNVSQFANSGFPAGSQDRDRQTDSPFASVFLNNRRVG